MSETRKCDLGECYIGEILLHEWGDFHVGSKEFSEDSFRWTQHSERSVTENRVHKCQGVIMDMQVFLLVNT